MDNLSLLHDKKVLYVEDDPVIRESITRVLEMFFDEITLACDGGEAMEAIKAKFDIVILDLNLPKYNGIEIAKATRALSEETLIFLISSYQETHYLREAMKLGAIEYLPKPLRFEDLKNVLQECANRLSKNELKFFGESHSYNKKLKCVYKENIEIPLTKNEIIFLELLLRSERHVLSYDTIALELFGTRSTTSSLSAIKNMILRMRKKLDTQLVESIAGVGYRAL